MQKDKLDIQSLDESSKELDQHCELHCLNKNWKFSTLNGYISKTDCQIFFLISGVQAVYNTKQLCYFREKNNQNCRHNNVNKNLKF